MNVAVAAPSADAQALAWLRLVDDRLANARQRTLFCLFAGLAAAAMFQSLTPLVWCGLVAAVYPVDRAVWRRARTGALPRHGAVLTVWVTVQAGTASALGPILWFIGDDAAKPLAGIYLAAGVFNALATFRADARFLSIGIGLPILWLAGSPAVEFALAGPGRSHELLYPALGAVILGLFSSSIWRSLAVHETTRIAEQSAALAEQARAREEGDVRGRVFAMVERELRAPLTALTSAVKRLSATEMGPAAAAPVRAVTDAAAVLSVALEDLSVLSTLQDGALRINPGPVDPKALAASLAEVWRPAAQDKWLELFLDVTPATPETVYLDEVRVSQIVHHLLANAVRFTRQGGVRLKVDAAPAPDGSGLLIAFTVSDTGLGMPPERLAELLRPGDRIARAAERGFGLATALCADVAEAMGGRLTGRSLEGQGTVLSLVAPARSVQDAPGQNQTSAEGAPAKALSILVVDDNAATRRLASVFLQEAGQRVETAAGAPQALALLQQQAFDLMLLDLRMPGMDGFALAKAVRDSKDSFARIPIVAFSADAAAWQEGAARAAGINGFLAKPFTPSSLLRALETALQPSQAAA